MACGCRFRGICFFPETIHRCYFCGTKKEGIVQNTYFHISDEPSLDNINTYKKASEIIRPLIVDSKTALSLYPIDPYLTTSGDLAYPSGDPYILYPAKDGVYGSIRGEITYEAIQDMNVCFALEELIGRDAVVKMIDDAAGFELRFDNYPRCKEYLENLRHNMIMQIQKLS